MGNGNEWTQYGDDNECSDTWMLVSMLGESAGCRLVIRQANASGFHANVWNEQGVDRRVRMRGECRVRRAKKLGREICSWAADCVGLKEKVMLCGAGYKWDGVNGGFTRIHHAGFSCNIMKKRWKCTLWDEGYLPSNNNTAIQSAYYSTKRRNANKTTAFHVPAFQYHVSYSQIA